MDVTKEETTELIKKLKEAQSWPRRLQGKLEQLESITDEVITCDEKIAGLEKRARAAMKTLGCVSSETQTVYQSMADMLIAWQMFKDNLPV